MVALARLFGSSNWGRRRDATHVLVLLDFAAAAGTRRGGLGVVSGRGRLIFIDGLGDWVGLRTREVGVGKRGGSESDADWAGVWLWGRFAFPSPFFFVLERPVSFFFLCAC